MGVLTNATPPGRGRTNSQVLLFRSLARHCSGRARWLLGEARHGWAIWLPCLMNSEFVPFLSP